MDAKLKKSVPSLLLKNIPAPNKLTPNKPTPNKTTPSKPGPDKTTLKKPGPNKTTPKPSEEKQNQQAKKSPAAKKGEKTPPAAPTAAEDDPENGPGAFKKFRIGDKAIRKLQEKDITYLFPVQYKTFDLVYDGADVLVQARTGTGKTLSFALPLVEKLLPQLKYAKRGRAPLVLVLAPTRELARQVCEDFESICDQLSIYCLYGGTPYAPQENAMRNGIDILVGTPGRILDHMERKNLDLSQLKHVVLDEVDQMLDMGFADSVDAIISSAYSDESKKPQTMLFSATLPEWVHRIAKKYMRTDVNRVDMIGQQQLKTSTTVKHLAIKCSFQDRPATIGSVVQVYSGAHGRAMVFCQTKKEADELTNSIHIKHESHVLHGDIPQVKREKVLAKFREGRIKVLVTTDVASRGLDIPSVDVVIQCNPPKDLDAYIHRSGRTGRAGRSGISICFYKPNELHELTAVERRAGIRFKKVGAPTTDDIIRASAKDAAVSLDTISVDTLEYFRESAKALIEERGAENALSAALAVISGSTDIVTRSLLSSREGLITYLFKTNTEIRSIAYVWNTLVKQLGENIRYKATNMRFCKDRMSCVFDLPCAMEESVSIKWVDGSYDQLSKAKELPELLDEGEGFGASGYRGGFGDRGGSRMGSSSRGGPRGGGSRGGMGGGYQGETRFGGSGSRFGGGGGSGYMNSISNRGRQSNFSRDGGDYNNQGYYNDQGFDRKRKYNDYSAAPFSRPNKMGKY